MSPRQRAEPFVRGRADGDRWSDEKRPLDVFKRPKFGRNATNGLMPPIAPFHLRSASLKFKRHPSAQLVAWGFLQRNLDFGHLSSAKSATSHARSTWPAASSSPRRFDLPSQLLLPPHVSRRPTKLHHPPHARLL